jgi:hypothetical protein
MGNVNSGEPVSAGLLERHPAGFKTLGTKPLFVMRRAAIMVLTVGTTPGAFRRAAIKGRS